MRNRDLVAIAAILTIVLLALVLTAPYMAPYGTFTHLDGTPAAIDNGWMGHGPAGAVYLLGDFLCHQEWDRSFILNGSQLPFCIRDVGILAGLPVGFTVSLMLGMRVGDRRWAIVGAALVLVTLAEWIVEAQVGDMPMPRLLSGFCAGTGAAVFLCWLLYRNPESVP